MVKIQPLQDRLVVKPFEPEEKTSGGIILPDTAKEKPTRGEVTAVGSGRLLENGQRVAPSVKVGEKVLFSRYSGTEIKIQGDEYRIISESDVLAVIE